ncbi:MAG: hypothetical protein ACRBBP_10590 [Bdellovibrionales bacterium]
MKHLMGALLLLFAVEASADEVKTLDLTRGPISSGGGMGVVCYDLSGKNVESVELLDLWEARKLYDRTIKNSDLSAKELVLEQMHNLKHSIDSNGLVVGTPEGDLKGPDALYSNLEWHALDFLYDGKLPNVKRLRGVELTLTNDAFEVIKPVSCKLQQLVRYTDTVHGGQILINQDLVDKMDSENLAALYLHEAFYTYLREFNEQSSIRVRRTIGLIMSGYKFEPWDFFLPKEYVECGGRYNKAYIYEIDSESSSTYKISMIAGRKMIGYDFRGALWYGKPSEVFTERGNSSVGVLGPVIGNDFSYRIRVQQDPIPVGEFPWSAYMRLTSSPDQGEEPGSSIVSCRLVSKK